MESEKRSTAGAAATPDAVQLENRRLQEQLLHYETRLRCLEDDAEAPGPAGPANAKNLALTREAYQELARYHTNKAADYALIALILGRDLGKSSS